MQAWVAFTVTALALAAILALFLPRRQLLLLGIAAVAGIAAPVLRARRAAALDRRHHLELAEAYTG
jgi:hypothetical protein